MAIKLIIKLHWFLRVAILTFETWKTWKTIIKTVYNYGRSQAREHVIS